jgi:hypothetical protein
MSKPPRLQPWPFIIVGFLATNVAIVTFTIIAATGDPVAKIEDEYDAKGHAWQQVKDERAKADELGWQVDCKAHGNRDKTADVKVLLYGRDGKPLRDATVRVAAFHDARPDDVAHATLADMGLGEHAGAVPMNREGRWTIQVEAARAGDRVARKFELWIAASDVAAASPSPTP